MSEKINNFNLRSEKVQEILLAPPNIILKLGSGVFLLVIITVILMSWFIKYPDTISAKVIVTTMIPPQEEFARNMGRFDTIFVKDLQVVKENQILAVLKNTANTKDVIYLKRLLDSLNLSNPQLDLLEQLPILFLGDIENSYRIFKKSYIDYLLNHSLQPQAGQIKSKSISAFEIRNRLKNLEIQLDLTEGEMKILEKKFEINQRLYKKGVISFQELETLKLELLNKEKSIKGLMISISQAREALELTSTSSKDIEIRKIQFEQTLYSDFIQSYTALKEQLLAWENNYVFKSNIHGQVVFNRLWNKNQVVNQGDLVFTILPNNPLGYIGKIEAPIKNSGKIKKGQIVFIQMDNFPEEEFGILKGIVQKVSLVPNEDNNYLVDVQLPQNLATSYDRKIEFKQNITGKAEIITEDLRLSDRIFNSFRSRL
tara:strand:- start:431 stop:1714 length:1284 start_codon:yes stop_codon:yes gene_type:complete